MGDAGDSAVSRALGFLGLVARSGRLASGEENALTMIRSGRAGAILIDEEAGANTRKRFEDACAFRSIPLISIPPGMLGKAIGKPARVVAAIPKGPAAVKINGYLGSVIVQT